MFDPISTVPSGQLGMLIVEAKKAAMDKRRAYRATSRGDCYEAAVVYLMQYGFMGKDKHLILVHGEVAGQGPLEGITFGHAWILDRGMVIDQSNGGDLRMPRGAYYNLGRIDEIGNVHEYTLEQARMKMLSTKVYGPWDLKTASGF